MHRLASNVLGTAVVCLAACAALSAQETTEEPDRQIDPAAHVSVPLTEKDRAAEWGLENRATADTRAASVKKYGGTPASEAAVTGGLRWLAAAQVDDGGWNFDHRLARDADVRDVDHSGTLTSARNAATAMALLPFLGSGQTHADGDYKQTVTDGLTYLTQRIKDSGSLHESGGTMYSHGLASIALCEAYALSRDKKLLPPAQAALKFIEYAQDPAGGGWRYSPRQRGDTSVTGWQLMALQSGRIADLQVSPATFRRVNEFLDSVQAGNGAYYGYTTPSKRGPTSAIGLLCRMHLGWSRDRAALKQGVEYLSAQGPSNTNMYYNYYATQIMFQVGGEHWDKWNSRMRDYLVDTQDKSGPEEGSWYFADTHSAARGGRIYSTSLATMILEVYYRHPRIYE